MSTNKMQENGKDVLKFIEQVENQNRKQDALKILQMMKNITKMKPKMWGSSIIGFGKVHFTYKSGREGDIPKIGFSPRKQALTLYLESVVYEKEEYTHFFDDLGKHRKGKSCLYINKLADIDEKVLEQIIEISLDELDKIIDKNEGWY